MENYGTYLFGTAKNSSTYCSSAQQLFKRKDLQILRGFRRDGEEVMEEVKYLLDVLIRNFCDSRVRDVGIEIERDAIAVDKICIHSCIIPIIILLREISGKRNGCPRFFDINRCNLTLSYL